jgi:hypothetical protein
MKQRKPPNAVLGVAIFQIAFGAIALLSAPYALLQAGGGGMFFFSGFPGAEEQRQFQDDLNKTLEELPYYRPMQYGGIALGLVVGAAMIVSAIGLLKMRAWARRLTIGYACYSMLNTIGGFIYTLLYVLPAMDAFVETERQKPNLPPGLAPVLGIMSPLMTVIAFATLLFLAYPIVLLVVLFRPHVREAFRPTEKPEEQ